MKEVFFHSLVLHAFKDGIHQARLWIKSFRINAPKYYDLTNSHIVFWILHISSVSESDLRNLLQYWITLKFKVTEFFGGGGEMHTLFRNSMSSI